MHRPICNLSISVRAVIALAVLFQAGYLTAQVSTRVRLEDRLEELRKQNEPQPGQAQSDRRVKLGSKSGLNSWDFPEDERVWLQGTPLTKEMLKGKAAVLLFFEEECPRCASRWPDMTEVSKQFEGKPIAFIAVNSGSDPRMLQQYARQQGISWSVIADFDRSFEKMMKVSPISLQNIVQVRYITADGVSHTGKWSDLPATAKAALKDAKWNVDPKEVPDELQDAWYDIEFGNYAKVARVVNKESAKSGPLQEAAEKLLAVVEKNLKEDYDVAKKHFRDKKKWDAYKQLIMIEEKYDGYKLPDAFEVGLSKLKGDETVKAEQKAMRSFDKANALLMRGKLPQAKKSLERLISGSQGTEAATKAAELVKQINEMQQEY